MARPRGHKLNPDAFEALLQCSGRTITDVAEAAGIERATLSGLIGGHSRAAVPNAHRIAGVLGCRPAAIFPTLRADFAEADPGMAA
jgi:transcriptional regulator with XRE-family HTH domain